MRIRHLTPYARVTRRRPYAVAAFALAAAAVLTYAITAHGQAPAARPLGVFVPGEAPPPRAAPAALDEVNALRAARGLRPYLHDPALTRAAQRCADVRAAGLIFGHTANDFQYLDPGVACAATGCAAYPASYGWLSCAVYDAYTYAGAAWALGRDGKRYMHLYVR